jgi:hypothetical protein
MILSEDFFANCFIVIISHILSWNSECSVNYFLHTGHIAS